MTILKKNLKIGKKKEEFSKNNSYYENLEKTSIRRDSVKQMLNMNMQEKHMLLTSMKKNSKYLFGDSTDEKRISPSKKMGSVNTTLFNIKSKKNANKSAEPPILSKPNYFEKTGMSYNRSCKENNHSKEMKESLRADSFIENNKQKDQQQKNISKSKTQSKYK